MREPTDLRGSVLLLSNNDNTLPLQEWLELGDERVVRCEEPLDTDVARDIAPRFAMSFNYRHIISAEAIEVLGCPIVNVHCSVLPWNRGAAPNFFSYYEDTPKGVTVHVLEAGLDKGGVLLQRVLDLGDDETFASSYQKLVDAAMGLLQRNWGVLSRGLLAPVPQAEGGSYHSIADFEAARAEHPFEWDDRICDWKLRSGLGRECC